MGESFANGDGETVLDAEDTSDIDSAEGGVTNKRKHSKGGGKGPTKYRNPKDLFSGPLLPTQVMISDIN